MSTTADIATHTQAITDLLNGAVALVLGRLAEAEHDALQRVQNITPNDYDYAAAAAYLSVPRRTLERRVAKREITYQRDGKRILFSRSALDQYKAARTITRREPRALTL